MSELSSLALTESPRFRENTEWFVAVTREGMTAIQVGATSERVVDLLHTLSASLDAAVDVRMADVRTARTWSSALLALPEVRETIGRLRLPPPPPGPAPPRRSTDTHGSWQGTCPEAACA